MIVKELSGDTMPEAMAPTATVRAAARGVGARRAGMIAMTTLAAGALLAGCGGAAAPSSPGGEAGGAAAPAVVPVSGDGAAVDEGTGDGGANGAGADGAAADGRAGDGGADGAGADGREGAEAADRGAAGAEGTDGATAGTTRPEVPDAWAGTYSAETLPDSEGMRYVVLQNLYGELRGATEMTSQELLRTEFLATSGASCEGIAALDGATARCDLAEDGSGAGELEAEVHLVPAAFGATSLLIEVDADGDFPLDVAEGPQGIGALGVTDPEEITVEDAEAAALTAVMMADAPDGELPDGLDADCELLDEGAHAVCEVTGTPQGGGDGTWYGTVQPGYGGAERGLVHVFTQLPV